MARHAGEGRLAPRQEQSMLKSRGLRLCFVSAMVFIPGGAALVFLPVGVPFSAMLIGVWTGLILGFFAFDPGAEPPAVPKH